MMVRSSDHLVRFSGSNALFSFVPRLDGILLCLCHPGMPSARITSSQFFLMFPSWYLAAKSISKCIGS